MIFEIHVTVKTKDINQFKIDVTEMGLKPIIIETQRDKSLDYQVMTSSKYNKLDWAFELNKICCDLFSKGYEIVRKKVEIVPEQWYDHELHIYYETHLRLKLPKEFDYTSLNELCKRRGFHLSKNLMKKSEDFNYQMITFRDYKMTQYAFFLAIKHMTSDLIDLSIDYDKVEFEECIYDSNESIDNNWLKGQTFTYRKEEIENIVLAAAHYGFRYAFDSMNDKIKVPDGNVLSWRHQYSGQQKEERDEYFEEEQ